MNQDLQDQPAWTLRLVINCTRSSSENFAASGDGPGWVGRCGQRRSHLCHGWQPPGVAGAAGFCHETTRIETSERDHLWRRRLCWWHLKGLNDHSGDVCYVIVSTLWLLENLVSSFLGAAAASVTQFGQQLATATCRYGTSWIPQRALILAWAAGRRDPSCESSGWFNWVAMEWSRILTAPCPLPKWCWDLMVNLYSSPLRAALGIAIWKPFLLPTSRFMISSHWSLQFMISNYDRASRSINNRS